MARVHGKQLVNPIILSGSFSGSFEGAFNGSGNIESASFAVTASHALFAVSASHEITFEVSSSYAHTASLAANLFGTPSIVVNDVTASGNISASGDIIGNNGSFTTSITTPEISGNTEITGDLQVVKITGNSITATSASLKHITNLTGIANDNITIVPSVTFQNPPQFNNGISGDAATGNSELKIGTSGFLGNTVSVNLTGTITASGNISASGTIVGSNLSGTNTGDQNISNLAVTGSDVIFGHITASGNISASGDLFVRDITANDITLDALGVSDKPNVILKRGAVTGISLEMGSGGNDNGILEVKNAGGLRSIRLEGGGNSFFSQSLNVGVPYSYPEPVGGTFTVRGTISSSGAINTLSHITASGNINAVGHLEKKGLKIDGAEIFNTPSILKLQSGSSATDSAAVLRTSNDRLIINPSAGKFKTIEALNAGLIATSITASGGISASGVINGQNLFGGVFGRIYPDRSQTSNNQFFTADANGINSNSSFAITGNVTASGNISASGDIIGNTVLGDTGSFDHITGNPASAAFLKFGTINETAGIHAGNTIPNFGSLTFQTFNSNYLTILNGITRFNNVLLGSGSGGGVLHIGNSSNSVSAKLTGHITASGNISGSSTTIFSGNEYQALRAFRVMTHGDVLLNSNDLPILSHDNSATPILTTIGSDDIGGSNLSQVHLITDMGEILTVSGSTVTIGPGATTYGTEALNVIGNSNIRGNVSSSGFGLFEAGKPITTHTTHFSASIFNAGHYLIVGGNLTCSISASTAPIGAEYEFFQTSSAGNMLFQTGSGVTLISKNNSLRLAQQGSSAVLKKVGTGTFHLMGDLT
jgi:hypothetical protein